MEKRYISKDMQLIGTKIQIRILVATEQSLEEIRPVVGKLFACVSSEILSKKSNENACDETDNADDYCNFADRI